MFDIALSPLRQLFGLGGDGTLYMIDRSTAATTQIGQITDQATGQPIASDANAMAFSSNGLLYVAAQDKVYTVDPKTAVATQVLTLPNNQQSAGDVVFDPKGNLYLSTTDGSLIKEAAGTTTANDVGGDGAMGVNDIFGLVWFDGVLYGFSNTGDTVYAINTSTGVAGKVNIQLLIPNPNGGLSSGGPNGIYGAAMLPV